MNDTAPSELIIARDLLVRVVEKADRYAIHAALDARWGRRGETGYLWCLGRIADGPAARVRLPPSQPDAASGLPLRAPPSGSMHGFRLRANITRKDGRSGHRRSWPRDDMAPRFSWLDRRAAEHGFRVEEAQAEVGRIFIRKGNGFWIDETLFTGTLAVTNTVRFAAALISGIGQRSAFGFGLLETFDPYGRSDA